MAIPAVSHNTPSAGYISWGAFSIQYQGVSYAIAAGNTNQRFVWWKFNTGGATTVLQAGADLPVLTGDDLVLFANKSGTALRVMATSTIDGDLLVDGSVFADALAANSVTGVKIKSDEIEARHLKTDSVTTNALKAGSVTTAQLTVGAVTDNAVVNGGFEDGISGWGVGENNGSVTLVTGLTGGSGAVAAQMSRATGTSNLQLTQTMDKAFPVTSAVGRSWYFSLRAGAATALSNGLVFRVHWLKADKSASATPYQDVYNGGVANAMTTYEGQLTPPSDARYARVSVYNTNPGTTFYVDEISANEVITSIMIGNGEVKAGKIAADAVTANEIAANAVTTRQLNVTMGGENLLTNSSFENDLAGWSVVGGSITATIATNRSMRGSKSLKLVNTTASGDHYAAAAVLDALLPNTKYTLSAWCYIESITAAASDNRAVLIYDGSASNSANTIFSTSNTGVWARHATTFTTSAAPGQMQIRLYSPQGTVYWDQVMVEQGEYPTAYSPRTDEILPGTILGTMIQADAINGKTITGATVQTSSNTSASRVVLGNGGLIAYNGSSPVTTISTSDGKLTSTSADITGKITASSGSITGNFGVTGVLFAGAAATSGARVAMTSGGFNAYNSAGTAKVTINAGDGLLRATDIILTGTITASGASITGDAQVAGSLFLGASATSGNRVRLMSSGIVGYDSTGTQVTAISSMDGSLDSKKATLGSGRITGDFKVDGALTVGASASTGPRVQLFSTGLVGFDEVGEAATTIDASDGRLTARDATITGVITGGRLDANVVTATQLSSVITFSQLFRTAEVGRRAEWDSDSMRFFDAAGAMTTRLAGEDSFFSGRASLGVLESASATLGGLTKGSAGGSFELGAGTIDAPANPLQHQAVPSQLLSVPGTPKTASRIFKDWRTGFLTQVSWTAAGVIITRVPTDGVSTYEGVNLTGSMGATRGIQAVMTPIGVYCLVGNNVLVEFPRPGDWTYASMRAIGLPEVPGGYELPADPASMTPAVAIGTQKGTNDLLIAHRVQGDRTIDGLNFVANEICVRRYTVLRQVADVTSLALNKTIKTGLVANGPIGTVEMDANGSMFDLQTIADTTGLAINVPVGIAPYSANNWIAAVPNAGAAVTAPKAIGASAWYSIGAATRGLLWDGNAFWGIDESGDLLRKFINSATQGNDIYDAYTYWNGSQETALSPPALATKHTRHLSRWSIPSLPTGVTQVRIYTSAVPGDRTRFERYGTYSGTAVSPLTVQGAPRDVPAGAAVNQPPAVSNFVGGSVFELKSRAPGVSFKGDGTGRVGSATFTPTSFSIGGVDPTLPPGTTIDGFWTTAPAGFALLTGQAGVVVDRASNPVLFAMFGTTYNTGGEAATAFRLPTVKGRTVVALDTSIADFNTIGKTGGEKDHWQTINEMPSHNHGLNGGWVFAWGAGVGDVNIQNAVAVGGATSGNRLYTYQSAWNVTQNNGGSWPMNNMQPYVIENKAIRLG